ncbi:MAG: murein hydrolase activator EnvC family protein [Casimicrobiaceae bacterium]
MALIAAAPLGAQSTDAGELESRRQALESLRSRVASLQTELEAAEAGRAEAADALAASERAISAADRRLHELSAERGRLTARLAALDGEAAALERKARDEQARLGRVLAQQYAGGRVEALKLFLSGRNPADVARLVVYYRSIGEARAELIARFRADRVRIAALTAEMAARRSDLDQLAHDEQAQRAALAAERSARAAVAARIARDVARQRRELGGARRDEARLAALVERLAKIARDLAPHSRDDSAGDGFARLKGKLELPTRGELVNRFGSPRSGGGTRWKGWFIRCPAGQAVRAIAAGQVVYAEWLRGFGNLLIIDHGDGYMSLYGYNEALLSTVGAKVNAGAVVAQSGASGGGRESGVYFEVRFQGEAVDPAIWIAP